MDEKLTCPQEFPTARKHFPAKRLDQFLAVIKVDAATGCWIWQGKATPTGYGVASFKSRTLAAHRLAWLIYKADIPRGKYLHHKCKVHLCVNPDHLECLSAEEHGIRHQSDKTCCSNGHPLTPENTYLYAGKNKIVCRLCRRKWGQDRFRKTYKPRKHDPNFCRRGHEMTPENTYVYRGVRSCRACHAMTSLDHYHCQHEAEALTLDQAPPQPRPPKTHCQKGHELTPENIVVQTWRGKTYQRCRTCYVARYQKQMAERKQRWLDTQAASQ